MLTALTYSHHRQLFDGDQWKPWVTKWFDNPVLVECGLYGHYPVITVTNWDQVKDQLPGKYLPARVEPVPE